MAPTVFLQALVFDKPAMTQSRHHLYIHIAKCCRASWRPNVALSHREQLARVPIILSYNYGICNGIKYSCA